MKKTLTDRGLRSFRITAPDWAGPQLKTFAAELRKAIPYQDQRELYIARLENEVAELTVQVNSLLGKAHSEECQRCHVQFMPSGEWCPHCGYRWRNDYQNALLRPSTIKRRMKQVRDW